MKALVLEGGSLRGVYTAGVLDILMENAVAFDVIYAVSAGALTAISYLSGQPGRSARISFEYVNDPRYMSEENLTETGDFFGFDFLMGEISCERIPLDFDALEKNPARFFAVAAELETGKAAFLEKRGREILEAAVASSSLPLIAVPKIIDGVKYMDGGLVCPIPFKKAMENGAKKVLVVTTRERGFRKTQKSSKLLQREQDYYSEYPAFADLLARTVDIYNEQLDELDALSDREEVFVISPKGPVMIESRERDVGKLKALYEEGRRDALEKLSALQAYL